MKAFFAILSALVPFTNAMTLSGNNVDILRSAESILHAAQDLPSSGNDHTIHTNDDGLTFLTHIALYSEVHGNLTFADTEVRASHDVEPTIWRLYMDCRDYSKGFEFQALDPFNRQIWWNVNYDRVIVGGGSYDMAARFQLRIGRKNDKQSDGAGTEDKHLSDGNDERQWMYIMNNNNGCIFFNKDGLARTGTLSACHPIKFKQIDEKELPIWEDPLKACSS